ncbi:allergen [Malassezia sympodialis ATCC 42132]|uniref:Superoxide dismutase n=1 Tax=Malassezia sympodialis (strain ATCC 42132) TaxID=1230383 RepID=M5ECN9_MALS4|nr:allergen [Malassezia sympodialis ATCC 42132]CCV00099.1 allergen [Malassezia sympodialis ATCC 42132]SHO80024.1 M. sympodialis allergen Mala s 11 [Malassezia sympodialis ATCC 42132]|eukprot:XP_018741308.1 allergen [Malassezia sympodialis ATCC 42132]
MTEHTLPPLPYEYNALEPFISADIMMVHHGKHHQTYVNNLNASTKAYNDAVQAQDVLKQMELLTAVKFNGGGHVNHALFWKTMAPQSQGGGQLNDGPLKQAIDKEFGDFEKFKAAFTAKALGIQGSGWCWLGLSKTGSLDLVVAKDQDTLTTHHPIIGWDGWEHAWYLQYKNDKASYLKQWWNVVNWSEAESRYSEGLKASL